MAKKKVIRREPKYRRKGETLDEFELRRRRYVERCIGDLVEAKKKR